MIRQPVPQSVRVTPGWLALREPADASARATELVDVLRRQLPESVETVVHDLGCGTGAMGRWLAPRLAGPQRWIMYDRDPELLARAAAEMPAASPTGGAIAVETRERDITALPSGDLAGASLVTASALLDMFTADELGRFVATCAAPGCPVLLTISVIGRVTLSPADPLDARVEAAFNAHQRRTTGGRTLLGPDASGVAAEAFARLGAEVTVAPSPWRLGPGDAALAAEWFDGWLGAALEQDPELAGVARAYGRTRREQARAGRLGVTVYHEDLLVGPR